MEQQVQSHIVEKNYSAALKGFSAIELQIEDRSLWEDSASSLGNYFYASYLACYLITGDLASAKYLWKRAPALVKSSESGSFMSEMWNVAKAIWQNDFPSVINSLSVNWPVDLQPIVFDLREQLLTSQLNTIARAYEHIPMESLSQKLNITLDETFQRARNSGWVVEGGIARPMSQSPQLEGVGNNLSDNLALLTSYAAHFDRAPVSVDK